MSDCWGKSKSGLAILPLVNCLSLASAFRHQGQYRTTGLCPVWHYPAMQSDNRPLENFFKKIVPIHLNRSQSQHRFDEGRRDKSPLPFLSPVLRRPFPWSPSNQTPFRGSYSGTNYDRWSYEQAAKGGTLADTPINRLQHKFWVARQVNSFHMLLCNYIFVASTILHSFSYIIHC
jgi:hypothetical protein